MPPALYRFADFELDLPRLELRHGDGAVSIQPKALDLLIYLVRERGRVVTKDELLSALWPDVVVTEASLSKAVAAARRALGDRAAEPEWIVTVWGRGFRFAGEVDEVLDATRPPRPEASGEARAAEEVFVGREELLAAIDRALASARGGEGRLLLFSGEAGMGKTRSAQEAATLGETAGFRVLGGWCHEAEGAPDLWPWLVALRPLLEGPEAGPLLEGIGDGIVELAGLLPALGAHLPPDAKPARLDPGSSQFRRLETLAEILHRATRSEPILLILDDFHRADPDSLSLLRFLARSLGGEGLALIVTHRVEELPVGHPLLDLSRTPRCESLPLAGLTRDHVAELIRAEVGRAVPVEVAEAIRERTDGNPFFVKELARGLDSAGRLDTTVGLAAEPLPAGIRNVLHERLDRLSVECRELLVLAALLGRDLDVALLARAAGCTPEIALQRLDEARTERVVQGDGVAFRFDHALLRDELLQPIPAVERARLHRTIGESIETHYGDDLDPHLGRLAHHFCAGAASGSAQQGVHYARLAGDRAVRFHAHREAADHYRRALAAQQLVATPDDALRCDLLLALGEACMASGEPRQGRETLERAAEAARRIGSPERFARAALGAGGLELSSQVGVDDPALVSLLEEALATLPEPGGALGIRLRTRLGEALYWSGGWERSVAAIEEAVRDGRKLGDPVALAFALYGRHWLEFVGPAPGARLEGADEMAALAVQAGHRELRLAAHSCRFLVLLQLGRGGEARVELGRYEELARQLRVPRYRWRGHCYQGALAALEGRFDDVESAVARTVAEEDLFQPGDAVGTMMLFFLHREQDQPPDTDASELAARLPAFTTTWRAGVAVLLADAGRLDEAREALVTLVERDFVDVPRSFNRLSELILAAEATAVVGDAELAARLHELLLPYRPRMVVVGGGFYCLGAVDLFLGRLAATAGDLDQAREHLEASLESSERSGAGPALAWTRYELARVFDGTGRARRLLAEAGATAGTIGMARLTRLVAELEKRRTAR